jgi:hypothetical protein
MTLLRAVLMLLGLIWAVGAQAHLLPKQNATINLIDSSAFLVVSVPVSAVPGADQDGNGLVTLAEIDAARPAIVAAFGKGLKLESDAGFGKQIFAWVMPPQEEDPAQGSDYVVVLSRYDFAQKPSQLELEYHLFGSNPGERRQTIKATHKSADGKPSEVAIFTRDNPRHAFFRGKWNQLIDFTRVGFEHIWSGFDHLLFLLTILIAGRGWRYWLGVTGAFTLAHSLTLTMAALKLVSLPASLVEPAIAASIAIVAAYNLFGKSDQDSLRLRVGIVFACGLLHGLGFAGALAAILGASSGLMAILVGFNLGIELGQLAFAALVLGAAAIVARTGLAGAVARLPRVASWIALTLGLALTVQRLVA